MMNQQMLVHLLLNLNPDSIEEKKLSVKETHFTFNHSFIVMYSSWQNTYSLISAW